MTQTITWSVSDMTRDTSTGGVVAVYWKCLVVDDTDPTLEAVTGAKLRLAPDASRSDFIAYDDLTENDVLGWVYSSLREGNETSDQAKTRVEQERVNKVLAQASKKSSQSQGVPWPVEGEA